jgi:hypothetical protein
MSSDMQPRITGCLSTKPMPSRTAARLTGLRVVPGALPPERNASTQKNASVTSVR